MPRPAWRATPVPAAPRPTAHPAAPSHQVLAPQCCSARRSSNLPPGPAGGQSGPNASDIRVGCKHKSGRSAGTPTLLAMEQRSHDAAADPGDEPFPNRTKAATNATTLVHARSRIQAPRRWCASLAHRRRWGSGGSGRLSAYRSRLRRWRHPSSRGLERTPGGSVIGRSVAAQKRKLPRLPGTLGEH